MVDGVGMVITHKLFWLARYGMGAIQQPSKLRGLLGLKLAAFQVHWFPPEFEPSTFPSLDQALATPPGLLAVGGKTSAEAMIRAFEGGVFICNQAYQPAKWWAPDPRMVLFPEEMYLQKTIQRLIRNDRFVITFDQAFSDVVDACAEPRATSTENWIPLLADAYKELHRRGHAFSVEAWDRKGNLAGGVLGLVSGRLLSVESMFTRVNHASKIALAHLCAHLRHWDCPIVDLQMPSPHLASLGCRPIRRDEYMAIVYQCLNAAPLQKPWKIEVKPDDDGAPILL